MGARIGHADRQQIELLTQILDVVSNPTTPVPTENTAWPVGSIYLSVIGTDPSVQLGYGVWEGIGKGRVLVGLDPDDPEFDAPEAEGGEKTHALTSSEMPAHTHVQAAHNHGQDAHSHTQDPHTHVQDGHTHGQAAHTHIQDPHGHTHNPHTHVQDPHTHTQAAHTHVQNPHSHELNSRTLGTGVDSTYELGTIDSSSTGGDEGIATFQSTAVNQPTTPAIDPATATTQAALSTGQAATAVNQPATALNATVAATNQPATGVNQVATAANQPATATNQSTGGGVAHNNLQPYLVVYMWKRVS